MALLGYEGFDALESSPELDFEAYLPFDKTGGNAQWNWSAGTGQTLGKLAGLLGGYGIHTTNFSGQPRVVFFTNYNTFICGFRYKTHSGNVSTSDIIYFWDKNVAGPTQNFGTIQCRLHSDATSGKLSFTQGDSSQTVLGTGTTVLVPNAWYYIEIKVTIGSGTSGSVVVRLAGAGTEISVSGVNTQTTANAWTNMISFLPDYNNDITLDDLYACDTTGPAPFNDFLGVIRVETLFPTNNATAPAWTPAPINGTPWRDWTNTSTYAPNTMYLFPWTPTGGGTVSKFQMQWNTSFTGNIEAAIYDSGGTGGAPSNLIASTTAVTNPTGNATQSLATFYDLTFSVPPTVVANTQYWIAFLTDTSNVPWVTDSTPATNYHYATTYAGGFPATLTPGSLVLNAGVAAANTHTFGGFLNPIRVQETNMDGDTSYNAEAGAGIDTFGTSGLQSTPTTIFSMDVVSAARKTDVLNLNYRNKMISGVTTSNGVTSNLATTYVWVRDHYAVDPNTGLAWTGANANAADIGYERF